MKKITNEEELQKFIIETIADLGMGLCEAQRLLSHIIALLPAYSKVEKKTT